MATPLTIKVEPISATHAGVEAVARRLAEHAAVRGHLGETRQRLLGVQLLDDARDEDGGAGSRFRATYYDYTNNRSLLVEGDLADPHDVNVTETAAQPLPSAEEFAEAVEIVAEDPELGPALRAERLRPYRPMPPVIPDELPDGQVERTLGVGLLPAGERKDGRHEIVGVNLIRRRVERYPDGAPASARAALQVCGVPGSGQPTSGWGQPGQVRIRVLQGTTELWRLVAVRPSASSGNSGSGVELRQVYYRGRRVLYQAHVPILNVKYDGDACGPYRDWQWDEGMIQATGTHRGPGFIQCPTPAKTILDTHSDHGNFLGVAVYAQGQEAVLVSEMEAGWYRYVSQWRLHADGTIRPRFGFDAVDSSCVCAVHHHHVYWRLDFSIEEAGNHVFREYNNPAVHASGNWHTHQWEVMRRRDHTHRRRFLVQNSRTGHGYSILPGTNDQESHGDAYARGDVWALRYRPNQIDDEPLLDGHTEIQIDKFKDRESIVNQDLVVWYGAHFSHDVHEEHDEHGHVVGPDLKPHNW